MSKISRVMVLTLYSGEGEVEACKASVNSQIGVIHDHIIFSFLGNVEAHEAVYRRIMAETDNFDVFVKLDADMTLVRPDALHTIARYFDDPTLDQITLPVFDVPSQHELRGIHAFSNRVRWDLPITNRLSPDRDPVRPGRHMNVPSLPNPLVEHMSAPTPHQAYVYGYHRALKIAQRGGHIDSPGLAISQYTLLLRIRKQFLLQQDRLRALMLLGFRDGLLSKSTTLSSKKEGPSEPTGDVVGRANYHWKPRSIWSAYVYGRYAVPRILRLKVRKWMSAVNP